jgi:iron-sulfur cluster assembly protein
MNKKDVITLTDKAAQYIHSIVSAHPSEDTKDAGLRVSIKKGGCSGSEYDFQYAPHKNPLDEAIHQLGVTVYIDPAALLNVLGSTMDYEETIFESKLIFTNPNEASRCGCGKSVQFTPIQTKENK